MLAATPVGNQRFETVLGVRQRVARASSLLPYSPPPLQRQTCGFVINVVLAEIVIANEAFKLTNPLAGVAPRLRTHLDTPSLGVVEAMASALDTSVLSMLMVHFGWPVQVTMVMMPTTTMGFKNNGVENQGWVFFFH